MGLLIPSILALLYFMYKAQLIYMHKQERVLSCGTPMLNLIVKEPFFGKNCTLTNVPYSDGASSDSYLKWTDVRTEFREIDWFFCTSNLAALLIIFLFWTAFYLYRSLKGGVLEFETTVTTSEKVKKRQFRCRINRILDN